MKNSFVFLYCLCSLALSAFAANKPEKPYITSWLLTIDDKYETFNSTNAFLDHVEATLNTTLPENYTYRGQDFKLAGFSMRDKFLDEVPKVYIGSKHILYLAVLGACGSPVPEGFLQHIFPSLKFRLEDYGHPQLFDNSRRPKPYRLFEIVPKSNDLANLDLSTIEPKYSPKFFIDERAKVAILLIQIPLEFIIERGDLPFDKLYEEEQREIHQKLLALDKIATIEITGHGYGARDQFKSLRENWDLRNKADDLANQVFDDFLAHENMRRIYHFAMGKDSKELARAIRYKILSLNDLDAIKQILKKWLHEIKCPALDLSFAELEFVIRLWQDVVACECFLGMDLESKICIVRISGLRPYILPFIAQITNKMTNIRIEIISSTIDRKQVRKQLELINDDEKIVVYLLTKKDSYHVAPLLRIADDKRVFWLLLETNAEKDVWFKRCNFLEFFDCLKLFVKQEKMRAGDKIVSGFLSRVRLISQDTGCRIIAFLNCRAIVNNLPEFISFLTDCAQNSDTKKVTHLHSLPHFITVNKQGLSDLDICTYGGLHEKARAAMVLIPKGGYEEPSKLVNANLPLACGEILEELVDQMSFNQNQITGKDIFDVERYEECVIQ